MGSRAVQKVQGTVAVGGHGRIRNSAARVNRANRHGRVCGSGFRIFGLGLRVQDLGIGA